MYTPGATDVMPPLVSSFSQPAGQYTADATYATFASGTFESANRAVYQPVHVLATCVARRVWWANGASAIGNNVSVGIYADSGYGPGAKLVSGAAVQSGTNAVQFVDVTDTTLAPGLYWIALVADATSNTTFFRASAVVAFDAALRFQQASAYPLPATATPAESAAERLYLFGFATTA